MIRIHLFIIAAICGINFTSGDVADDPGWPFGWSPPPSPPTAGRRRSGVPDYSPGASSQLLGIDLTDTETIAKALMPSERQCGFQYIDRRFDNSRKQNEIPWVADVLCNKNNKKRLYEERCSGVLINTRYVLTTKNCGMYADRVRLGAYSNSWNMNYDEENRNIETPFEPDLLPENYLYEGLGGSDSTQFFKIAEYLVYDDNASDFTVALLRLAKTVIYSDFIRPICLTTKLLKSSYQQFKISGWEQNSGYKRRLLAFERTNDDDCYNRICWENVWKINSDKYMCCMHNEGSSYYFLCRDDEGGPIMYLHKSQWYLRGLIDSVYTNDGDWCSTGGNAYFDGIIITREIIEWIFENIHS